jgi:HlyD family secretion protein
MMGQDHTVEEKYLNSSLEEPPEAGRSLAVQEEHLPARVPAKKRRGWSRLIIITSIIGAGGVAGAYWWTHRVPPLPPGIAFGNGRLEADEIDIQTKFAGRVLQLLADEGDLVNAGQVLAIMDTRDLQASLNKAEAQVRQAQKAVEEANSIVEQFRAQLKLAEQEADRTAELLKRGFATHQLNDQRIQQLNSAKSALLASEARVTQAHHALEAAEHEAHLINVNIADNTLTAPRAGRIQYRLTNTGEVLGVGGKVFIMLDVNYVYMDVYLPTAQAGRVKIGTEARILLDAYPGRPIPAHVSFLATQNQFDPKVVETKDERDKLMFRVRARIDPKLLKAHAESVRSGLPGMSYIRLDANTPWPERLAASLVQ